MSQSISGQPIVSVVMPAYNCGGYLSEAIESILQQTFTDFEFIILNDGSTDDTSTILHRYTDKRIHIVERENRGFAASLNEAILLSRGKYIARMDADDVSLINRLQLQYEYMEKHPEVDILGGQAFIIDQSGKIKGEIRKPVSFNFISKYISYACPLIHSTYFIRKYVYENEGIYRDISPGEDYDFLLRSFEKGYVMANLPDKILQYRRNITGMSQSNPQRTLVFSNKIRYLHELRTMGKESEDEVLSFLATYNKQTGTWFRIVYNTRNKLLGNRHNKRGVIKNCISLIACLVSCLHYQVFWNTYNGFKSIRWNH